MMSQKTFSLTILITLLALAFIVPSALAGELGKDFKVTITLANPSDIDTNGMVVGDNQFALGTTGATPRLKVVFDKRVNLLGNAAEGPPVVPATGFAPEDVKVMTFNKMTGETTTFPIADGGIDTDPQTTGDANLPNPWAMFTVTLPQLAAAPTAPAIYDGHTVVVTIAKGAAENADPADVITAGTGDDTLGKNDKGSLRFEVVAAVTDRPNVASIDDLPSIVLGPDANPAFTFKVTLSEKPKEFKKDHIEASNATVSGDPVFAGTKAESATVVSTELSNLVYEYLVTVAPKYESKDDIVIKIKSFEDVSGNKSLVSMPYMVKVNSDANKKVALSGREVNLTNKAVVPGDGYLVVAKDKGMSLVIDPGNAEHGAGDRARRDRAFKVSYNLVAVDLGVSLEGFLTRGGTIDLVSPNAGLAISEVMWATDGGSRNRQWIEISNMTSADIKFGDKTHKLMLYESSETLPDMSVAANKIVDRVSTLYRGTNHWSIAGKGQSGRINPVITREVKAADTDDVDVDIEVVDTAALISMQRAMAADGTYADGTMDTTWSMSIPPAQNLVDGAQGLVVATPGTAPITPVTIEVPEEEALIPVAMASDITITEIMVDTDRGQLPQWIELTSWATSEVSLAGWEMRIDNAIDDTVLGGGNIITIDLSDVILDVSAHTGNMGKGQSALVVAWAPDDISGNIRADRVVNVATQLNQTRRYQLLSYIGFKITLAPPQTGGVFAPGDIAGNLHEDWELPMSRKDDPRSSMIRREMLADGMATMGTDANGWRLAGKTSLTTGHPSFYGSDEDESTPLQDAGGPLPVELSHFRPARDTATGAVVITWSTQSELNNAGFFIKRSQQRDGQFKVINATMVPGAGTTSEKQFYTYTDTTAQPNVVYYYQIEDISLDGQRQTLTNGIRLKGHIGAAGKLTTSWGELKSIQ